MNGNQHSVVLGPKDIAAIFAGAVDAVAAAGSPTGAKFANLDDLLDALRIDFAALPHTAELVGLRSENGMHRHTVDVHTNDVVAKLRALPNFQILEPKRQRLVELAAYLHDIGKGPKSRWTKNGGLQKVDPNHPVGAMSMMVDILTQHVASVKPKTVRRLLKLVCYHDLVGDIVGRDRDERQLVDVAENRLDLDMLILIGHADASSLQERWEWNFVQKATALRNRCAPLLASDS
jgi:UTP:GlnB (protein PII) uridylyltransferase